MMQPFFAYADAVPAPEPTRPVRAKVTGRCASAWSAPTRWSRRAGCRTTSSAWPGICASAAHAPSVLAPASFPARLATTLAMTSSPSAGTAVPLRYNGSVAQVGFGPLTAAGLAAGCAAEDFDLVHVRADHSQRRPARPLGRRVPVMATFHRDAAVPVDLQLAVACCGRRWRSCARSPSAIRPGWWWCSTWVAMRWSSRTASGRDFAAPPRPARRADRPATPALPRPHRRAAEGSRCAAPGLAGDPPGRPGPRGGGGRAGRPTATARLCRLAWSTSCRRRTCCRRPTSSSPRTGPGRASASWSWRPGWWRSGGRLRPAAVRRAPRRHRPGPAERGVLFAGGPDDLAQAVVDTLTGPTRPAASRPVTARRFDWAVVAIESVYRPRWTRRTATSRRRPDDR